MPRPLKPKLGPQARALYAQGLTHDEIAAALGITTRSVSRWCCEDREAGRPWTHGVDAFGARPDESPSDRLYRRLQERLEELLSGGDPEADPAKLEDRALKVCKLMEYLRTDREDVGAQLECLRRFATFCVQNLTEDEMNPVRKAVGLFIEQMRKEHS